MPPPKRPPGPRAPRGAPPHSDSRRADPGRPNAPRRGALRPDSLSDHTPRPEPSRRGAPRPHQPLDDPSPARNPRDRRGFNDPPRRVAGHATMAEGSGRRGDATPPARGAGAASPRHDRAPREARPEAQDPLPKEGSGIVWLHGLHAVAAAIQNPRRRLRRLLLTAEAEATLTERLPPHAIAARKLRAERVEDRARFHTFLPEDSVHQGAALLAEKLPGAALDHALAASPGPVLVLDQVTDPRNVGAILRSAAAFGACAVVVQDRHAPPETGALARAASGALELVPMVREVNLSRAIRHLQEAGAWVMGLAGDAPRTLAQAKPAGRRAVLVLGAEGAGLRRLQRESCDELVRLPIAATTESLNVAAAAAVALYEIGRDA